MRRSQRHLKSYSAFSQLQQSRNLSQKCIYVTEESSKRDVETIFHSPYKNGVKNPNYNNPSFISSHLFYPGRQLTNITKGIIPNNNDVAKSEMYNKRINKSNSTYLPNNIKDIREQKPKTRIRNKKIISDPQEKLKKQLQNLISYRDNNSRKIITNRDQNLQYPIYLNKSKFQRQEIQRQNRKQQLKQWMKIAGQIAKIKQNYRKEQLRNQNEKVSLGVSRFRQKVTQNRQKSHKNAELLKKILLEQIKQKEQKNNKNIRRY